MLLQNIGIYNKMFSKKSINLFLFTFVTLFSLSAFSKGSNVHVNGYFRSNGTYVQPHYRTAPDHNFYNNWSTKGNVNPYTGKVGTKDIPSNTYSYPHIVNSPYHSVPYTPNPRNLKSLNSTLPKVNNSYPGKNLMEFQKREDIERAKYWKLKGYNFSPNYTTSFMMDQKVHDIERAQYWKSQGYDFDANYMTSFMMDQKVKDIQRARYWKAKGYNFDANYMTDFMMDHKVRDIQRSVYWKSKGLNFNPNYMTDFMMDMEARNRGIH